MIAPTTGTTPGTTSQISVLLTDFWLNLETIQIGPSAMESVLSNLHDGKMFLHGTTYKTTTALIPQNTAGQFNLPVGLTGSSVRSLFTRFSEQSATATWGKYNSGCPNLNQFGFYIGGIQVPASLYNPLLYPAQCWRSFLMAMGNFNSTQQKSGITALNYCVLSSGGTATVPALGSQSNTQDSYFATTNATPNYQYQSSFLLGENIETIPKRGLISGRDLTFQKVNLVLGLNATLTNPVNVYVTAMMDTITIVDVVSGEVVTIL